MNRCKRPLSSVVAAVLVAALPAVLATASAQSPARFVPAKPVRVLIGYAAGGLPDTVARVVAQRLSDKWGQQMVVDNRPSSNGILAGELLAKAAPDGYTLLCTDSSTTAVNPVLFQKLPYDPDRDFVAVSLAARAPLFVAAHPSVPVDTLADFIALAKASPGKFNYGSSGIGSTHHLTMSSLASAVGIDVVHVPYKGTGQSVPALVGGQVSVVVSAFPSLAGFVKSNQVKLLAVNSAQRSALAPAVPSIAEVIGQPGFDFAPPIGYLAPAKTPEAIVEALARDIAEASQMPEVVKQLAGVGIEAVGSTPREYAAQLKADAERYARAIREAKLKAE